MKNKYPFIDGLRMIAVLMVFYEHVHFFILLQYFKPLESPLVSKIYFFCLNKLHLDFSDFLIWFNDFNHRPSSGQGPMGVNLFFLISGFLITRILVTDYSNLKIGRFYVHRFLKIYPSYFCLVIVTFICYFYFNHYQYSYLKTELPIYLFFFQNTQGDVLQNLGHTWSLVVEEQFYFFYPIFAFLIFRMHSSPIIRRYLLMALCVIVMILAPIIRYTYNFQNNMVMAFFYHFDALALGCLLALNEDFIASISHKNILGIFFWILGIGLYLYLTFIYQWGGEGSGKWYVYDLAGLDAMSIFLAGYYGITTFSGLKLFQWLGRYSYGIYLWHFLILTIFFPYIDKISPILMIILFVPLAILIGVISTNTIEKYFLGVRKRILA